MAYIPNALDSYPDGARKTESMKRNIELLTNIGFDITTVSLKDYFGRESELATVLRDFNAFHVAGGNTYCLRQAMKLSGFDSFLTSIFASDDYLYSGSSAGACVMAGSLHGLDICDKPQESPYNEIIPTIWKGLGVLDYLPLPHYKSNHHESALIDLEVARAKKQNIPHKTLRDGDVIVINTRTGSEKIYSAINDFAIIFDMDGVIICNSEFHTKAWNKFCSRYATNLTEEEKKQYIWGRTNKSALEYIFKRGLSKEEVYRYGNEKEEIYRELYKPHLVLTENLVNFLDLLKNNNIPAGVATSANKDNVDFIMNNTGIRKYFSEIVDADQITNGKPNPEIYLKAATQLGFSPSKCIVIEDSVSGIKSGKNAGMKVIAITNTHTRKDLHMADLIIDDFNELNNINKLIALL